jgi:adenylate cyclase
MTMGQGIERKFLVVNDTWRNQAEGKLYRQGYVPTTDARTVRVRTAGDRGYLTLKGPVAGITRSEFEYEIPIEDAQILLATLCDPPLIEKYRYRLPMGDVVWEIDEFLGENQGLIMAEVELSSAEQLVDLPSWVGREVTGDKRYYNSNLAREPYRQWTNS